MAVRASTTTRGYGSSHAAERRRWEPIVKAGGVCCPHCGRAIVDGKIRAGSRLVSSWHLDHVPGTSEYRGPAHVYCNTSDGARRGNATRRGRRRPIVRTWGAW